MWTGTRVPRNTGFPPMILPFNRSLVGARVERISSARAPEMCPFSKTIRENQTVRETFQGFGAVAPVERVDRAHPCLRGGLVPGVQQARLRERARPHDA